MRRKPLLAAACLAALSAGCGGSQNSNNAATHKPAPAIAAVPHKLEVGPPPSGTRYDAVNHAFLERVATILGHAVESQGLHDVSVTCTASVPARLTCQVNGLSGPGHSTSGSLTMRLDRTTGALTVTPR